MTVAPFDPAYAVRFDLSKGVVLASSDERVVVLGVPALETLCRTADEATLASVAHAVGWALGQRVADRFGGAEGVRDASLESFVSHLAGELAVAGFGLARFERWGKALVVTLERPALRSDRFLAGVLSGALEASAGKAVTCEPLSRDLATLRLLVARESTARRVRGWLAGGASWSEALARLQHRTGAEP